LKKERKEIIRFRMRFLKKIGLKFVSMQRLLFPVF